MCTRNDRNIDDYFGQLENTESHCTEPHRTQRHMCCSVFCAHDSTVMSYQTSTAVLYMLQYIYTIFHATTSVRTTKTMHSVVGLKVMEAKTKINK